MSTAPTTSTPRLERDEPLVSVVIPCFNAAAFIGDAIQSVLGQTPPDLEVIVVDDASTDGSRELVTALAESEPRIVPILLPSNAGPAAARNRGFEQARGRWVALLDADDLYLPDRLATLIELAESTGADVVADNQRLRDLDYGNVERFAFSFLTPGELLEVDRRFFFSHIWKTDGSYPMGLLKPVFRRAFVAEHRIAYDMRYRLGEDFLFYLECVMAGARFWVTGDAHYVYRYHRDSLSHAKSSAYEALARMCDEIAERHRDTLDAESLSQLRRRRAGCRALARSRKVKELQALRRSGGLPAIAGAIGRNPRAGLDLLSTNAAWRMRQLSRLVFPRASRPTEAQSEDA